jgi:GWxTD domain-containing protein
MVVLAVVMGLAPGCRVRPPPAAEARAWAAGPVQWLLLPEERRQVLRVRNAAELESFIREFWHSRRCGAPGGDFAALFALRVAAADRLYGEEGLTGGLTDRGRALILLGPPQVLRYSQRTVPAATPTRGSLRPTRILPQEEWVYQHGNLPAALRDDLAISAEGEITLVFLMEPRRTVLVHGERMLQEIARALARPPPEDGGCEQRFNQDPPSAGPTFHP